MRLASGSRGLGRGRSPWSAALSARSQSCGRQVLGVGTFRPCREQGDDLPAVKPGRVLGHQAVDTVVRVGVGVSGLVPGDRVPPSCISACKMCRTAGRPPTASAATVAAGSSVALSTGSSRSMPGCRSQTCPPTSCRRPSPTKPPPCSLTSCRPRTRSGGSAAGYPGGASDHARDHRSGTVTFVLAEWSAAPHVHIDGEHDATGRAPASVHLLGWDSDNVVGRPQV